MADIVEIFYRNGGYESDSIYVSQSDYISFLDVTSTYIPQANLRLNALCDITASVDYTSGSVSSGNLMDDLIIAELALSIADSEYDKVHVDPDTGEIENKHWLAAYRYMLDMYGVTVTGAFGRIETQLPKFQGSSALIYMEISTMSL